MTIILTIIAFILGALFAGHMVRSAYESYIDDMFDEMNQSEEDFLGYAYADKKHADDAKRRAKEEHDR